MDVSDRLNLDRALWALEDAKQLTLRAATCLKYHGWIVENEKLNQIYYSIQDILDKIEDEVTEARLNGISNEDNGI